VQTRRVPFCSQCGTDNPDAAKFCFACGSPLVSAPPAAPPQEVRKVVSIVFSDLKGSTAMGEKLDSESLREVMTRYFDAMSAELEKHGGVVEKFIGDAIMAVFGLPTVHEDDALRAVRAAADMQRAQAVLNDELERHWGVRLTVRTGVNTGQVVAGDPSAGQRLVTGDAVNVAARLEQAAGAQEVLLGDLTYRLVRDYVDVEEVEPLELKGKAERVPAYRLVGVRDDAERPRRLDSPMIGREQELALLQAHLRVAIDQQHCRLATVVGEAGVGKSRLIDELIASLADDVTILRGRCLPYGDGITFWPLAEAVRGAAHIAERDTTEIALRKLATLADDDGVTERVASAIGLSSAHYAGEELAWGARKLLETLGREHPVLVLFEDIHWAEPTFLELVQHVVEHAGSKVLIVCTARHELVERQPEWSIGADSVRLELARLTEDETTAVAEHLLGMTGLDESILARIIEAAEGNPLFVEQLLSMMIDDGVINFDGGVWRLSSEIADIKVPPTIHALLAARLDSLDADDRAVIEPASVIGQVFVEPAVWHLAPERVRPVLPARLESLIDKQLLEPDSSRTEEDAFRFHHILIRDTTYDAILKRARATLHEQFVEWADAFNREGATEYEEILGYHLEQAHRYLSELGPLDAHGLEIGADGARRLAAAGRRAFARGDMTAATNLLERAAALLEGRSPERLGILVDLSEAVKDVGDFDRSRACLTEARDAAYEIRDSRLAAHASVGMLLLGRYAGETAWAEHLVAEAPSAKAIFERADDHAGLAKVYRLEVIAAGTACQFAAFEAAAERYLYHARLAGDSQLQTHAATAAAIAALLGPTPVPDAILRCAEALQLATGNKRAEALVLTHVAQLHAMQGDFEHARDLYRQARASLDDLGVEIMANATSIDSGPIELLAGEFERAENELRGDYDVLSSLGETYFASSVSALLAEAVEAQGRDHEAEELTRAAESLADEDDVWAQATWRSVRARVLAKRGEHDQALELARASVQLMASTDAPIWRANAARDYADVLRRAERLTEAEDALREALDLYERKGSAVAAARVREALAELSRESSSASRT
jgi:class 3 adenylate cyclase/tetratricopeptide (TPR) repeat protein